MHDIDPATLLSARLRLAQLPEFEPDVRLWSRIEHSLAQPAKRRGGRRMLWLGSAAAAALAAVVIVPTAMRPSSAEGVEVWLQRSHTLEQAWRAEVRSASDPLLRARLQLIDGELQAAYDRGARNDELLTLWKQRGDALQQLLESSSTKVQAVVRI